MDFLSGLLGRPVSKSERFQIGLLSNGDPSTAIRLMLGMQQMQEQQGRDKWTGDLAQSLASLPPEQRAKYDTPEAQQSLRASTYRYGNMADAEGAGLLAPQQAQTEQPAIIKTLLAAGLDPKSPEIAGLIKQSLLSGESGAAPYYQFLPTDKGYMVGNARTGGIDSAVGFDGRPIVRPADSPDLQRTLAEEKARGRVLGTKGGEAAAGLPKVVARTDETMRLVQELKDHPGKSQAVGMSSVVPLIPGTAPYDFEVRRKQIAEGQNFLAAIQEMRGLGVLTEQEGTKATVAIARMERAQSEPEFDAALDELMATLQRGKAVAEAAAGVPLGSIVPGSSAAAPAQRLQTLREKYGL